MTETTSQPVKTVLPMDYASILAFRKSINKRLVFEETVLSPNRVRSLQYMDGAVQPPKWYNLTDTYDQEKRDYQNIVEKYKAAVAAQQAKDNELALRKDGRSKTILITSYKPDTMSSMQSAGAGPGKPQQGGVGVGRRPIPPAVAPGTARKAPPRALQPLSKENSK
eukprot:PhF_6_TR30132/c0_g1_i1/m.44064